MQEGFELQLESKGTSLGGYILVIFTAFVTLLGFAINVSAAEPFRPQNHSELENYAELIGKGSFTEEMGIPVEVKVAWANYALIRADFPQIAHYTDAQIDTWLVQNFGYIGSKQKMLDGIRQTPIPVDPSRSPKPIYRPPDWVRSGVLEAFDHNSEVIGMMDAKGIGHGLQKKSGSDTVMNWKIETQVSDFRAATTEEQRNEIRTRSYSDGLMSLGESIAELTRQQAVQKSLELHEIMQETVESYAILTLPTHLLKTYGESIPAAIYLRQAHFGRVSSLPSSSEIYKDAEGNRQGTFSKSIVDFGGVEVTEPLIRHNFSMPEEGEKFSAQGSKPWIWGHEVARAYENGNKDAIRRHLREMLGPLAVERPITEKRARLRTQNAEVVSHPRLSADQISQTLSRLIVDESVIEKALNDSDGNVRHAATRLFNVKTKAAFLQKALNDESKYVRETAAYLLGHIKSATIEHFKMAFADSDPAVGRAAVDSIQYQPGERIHALIELAFKSEQPDVRRAALERIRNQTDARSLRLLHLGLNDSDESVRNKADYLYSLIAEKLAPAKCSSLF